VVDYSGCQKDSSFHQLQNVTLDVQAYELHENEDDNAMETRGDNEEDDASSLQMKMFSLPNKTLDGAWESQVQPLISFLWVINH
jgi:hypothetical protein